MPNTHDGLKSLSLGGGRSLGRALGSGGGGLAMQGAAVEAQPHSPPRSMLSALQQPRAGSELGGQRLSAEEEAALFADVDALDPESRVEVASSLMRAAELEAPTRTQVSKALALDDKAVGDKSVEEINAALGARAAALEAQLRDGGLAAPSAQASA